MKRTAIILGIAAAIGVSPSVAAAGNVSAQVKPQLARVQVAKVQVAKVQVAKVQVARAHRVVAARYNAQRASLSGLLALYPH